DPQVLDTVDPCLRIDHRHAVGGRPHLAGTAGMPVALDPAADPFDHQLFVLHDLVEPMPRLDDEIAQEEIPRRPAEAEQEGRGVCIVRWRTRGSESRLKAISGSTRGSPLLSRTNPFEKALLGPN